MMLKRFTGLYPALYFRKKSFDLCLRSFSGQNGLISLEKGSKRPSRTLEEDDSADTAKIASEFNKLYVKSKRLNEEAYLSKAAELERLNLAIEETNLSGRSPRSKLRSANIPAMNALSSDLDDSSLYEQDDSPTEGFINKKYAKKSTKSKVNANTSPERKSKNIKRKKEQTSKGINKSSNEKKPTSKNVDEWNDFTPDIPRPVQERADRNIKSEMDADDPNASSKKPNIVPKEIQSRRKEMNSLIEKISQSQEFLDVNDKSIVIPTKGGLMELDFIREPLKITKTSTLNDLQFTNEFRINRCFPSLRREEVDNLFRRNVVKINNTLAHRGSMVRNGDIITVNGEMVQWVDPSLKDTRFSTKFSRHRYLKVFKPAGVQGITVKPSENAGNIATLAGCMEHIFRGHFFPIGSLEVGYSGLMLMTNDSDLSNAMNVKELAMNNSYAFSVRGAISFQEMKALKSHLEDLGLEAVKLSKKNPSESDSGALETTIYVFVKEVGDQIKDIRKAFDQEKIKILHIQRLTLAGISLAGMSEGSWKFLSDNEMRLTDSYLRKRKHLLRLQRKNPKNIPREGT